MGNNWQVYAASFFAIPFFRWMLLLKNNSEITKRNQARLERAQALEFPSPPLRKKVPFPFHPSDLIKCAHVAFSTTILFNLQLLNARDMASQKVIRPEEIVYTTRKDITDQDYEEKEWLRRFEELESD